MERNVLTIGRQITTEWLRWVKRGGRVRVGLFNGTTETVQFYATRVVPLTLDLLYVSALATAPRYSQTDGIAPKDERASGDSAMV